MLNVKSLILGLILCCSLLCTSLLHAEGNPQIIIQKATAEMMDALKSKRTQIEENPSVVSDIVEELILPHIAANTIARKVMGKYARTATDEQKTKFSDAFRGYLIRFYSNAFAEYKDETVDFSEPPEFQNEKRVTVKTLLNRSSGTPIPIDYRMQRSGDSWKIIDVTIEGISLVISNKTQFGNSISRDGLDTVIAKLEYKNEQS